MSVATVVAYAAKPRCRARAMPVTDVRRPGPSNPEPGWASLGLGRTLRSSPYPIRRFMLCASASAKGVPRDALTSRGVLSTTCDGRRRCPPGILGSAGRPGSFRGPRVPLASQLAVIGQGRPEQHRPGQGTTGRAAADVGHRRRMGGPVLPGQRPTRELVSRDPSRGISCSHSTALPMTGNHGP